MKYRIQTQNFKLFEKCLTKNCQSQSIHQKVSFSLPFPYQCQDLNTNKLLKIYKNTSPFCEYSFFHFLVNHMNPIQIHRSNCSHCALFRKWYLLYNNPIPLISFSKISLIISSKKDMEEGNVRIIFRLKLGGSCPCM